jgi:hypothetical protein
MKASKQQGTDLLCSRSELQEVMARLEREKERVLHEFRQYFTGGIVDVVFEPKKYVMGWGVGATLTFDGEPVRHYELAGLCLLDLNEMMLKRLSESRQAKGERGR